MILDAKRIAAALTLALIAGGSWWLTRTVSVSEIVPDGKTRHDPDYTIEKFTMTTMNEQGRKRYSLAARQLLHYADDGSSDLDHPYLIQYREGNAAPVHTRADKGWIPKDGSQILMSGNVLAARGRDPLQSGGEIRTDSMKIMLDK
ncbi:MAG: LPS export ABC transporter periplasmic protein LptC [Pseudomonadota bacterium]